jgi:hypothetical protein
MEKTGIVTTITPNGTWDSPYGLMYKFDITIDDKDGGQYMSKTKEQNKFVLGESVTYTIDNSNPTYPKIKPVFVQNTPKGNFSKMNDKTQIMIVKQTAIKEAVNLLIHDQIEKGELFEIAEDIKNYVLSDIRPNTYFEKKHSVLKENKMNYENTILKEENDGLPF